MGPAVIGLLAAAPVASGAAAQTWIVRPPTAIVETGRMHDRRLRESSGAARGIRNPAVFWTVNDSGNDATVFAVDTAGRVRAAVGVRGASNVDWEALAAAPCGPDACLYVGDVGDNLARRRSLTLYRIVEPPLDSIGGSATAPVRDSVSVTLEGGARDIEAMVVTVAGDVALVAKGWAGEPSVHWIPATAWEATRVEARLLGPLPFATGLLRGRLVTDAALSPEGDRLAVRTYREIFLFRRAATSRELPDQPEHVCDVTGHEPLGEGITWWSGDTLLLTSERSLGQDGPVLMVRCDP